VGSLEDTDITTGVRWRAKLARWSRNRTVVVLVPVHVVAFVSLYLGTSAVVRREILATHIEDAKTLARQAISGLSPYMASHMPHPARPAVAEWSDAHHLLGLELYGRSGATIDGSTADEPRVRAFLDGSEDQRFSVVSGPGTTILDGLVRIRATDTCASCHTPGDVLGAATMRIDLSEPVATAQRRIRRNLLVLIAGWGLVVGLVNVTLGGWARRSLSELNGGEGAGPRRSKPKTTLSRIPRFPVDAVSAEIYASLRQLLRQRALQQQVVDERLHHQQRLASLGELTAGLAHEIKNPLSGIHGVLELLRDDAADPGQRELYQRMLAELDRVNGTIHSLLSFSRPTSLEKLPTNIGTLIESSVQLHRTALASRGISIRVICAPHLPELSVDQNLLRQALINLVSNSADAIDHDGAITITAVPLPAYSGVAIAVADDGPGIADEHRDHVTEPFFTTKFTGTGLGLAIVRNIVGAHGGTLEIESQLGRGTSVFIVLPTDDTALGTAAGA
jgi:signal transduction histidine kinase